MLTLATTSQAPAGQVRTVLAQRNFLTPGPQCTADFQSECTDITDYAVKFTRAGT